MTHTWLIQKDFVKFLPVKIYIFFQRNVLIDIKLSIIDIW